MRSHNILSEISLLVSTTNLLELKEYVCKHECIRVAPTRFTSFDINGGMHWTIKIALKKKWKRLSCERLEGSTMIRYQEHYQ